MTRTRSTGSLSAPARIRVVAWIVLISGLGMALLLGSLVVALRWMAEDGIRTSITQEVEEVGVFAANGLDPATGEQVTGPDRFVELYLERQRAEPSELIVGGSDTVPVIGQRAGERAVGFEALDAATREALLVPDRSGRMTDPVQGTVSWANVTIRAGEQTGHIVVAVLHRHVEEQVAVQALLLGLLALAGLAATGLAAWVLAGRILGHTAEFDAAVRRAARGRGVPRLPEEGSDEYAALAKGANRLLRRADRALARERSFAQDITLTLRTSSAMLEAGLRSPGGTAQQWRTTADELAAEATRARELLDDLALLTRLDSADLTVDPEAVEVAEVVAVAARGWRERADQDGSGVEVRVAADPSVPAARVEPARLVQVLEEVLDNARDAVLIPADAPGGVDVSSLHPTDRTILVRVHALAAQEHEQVTIDVSDRGRGVPEDERAGLTARLVVASNDPRPGNGLGLAVARGLMEAMGGELRILGPDEAEAEGTTVRLLLTPALVSS